MISKTMAKRIFLALTLAVVAAISAKVLRAQSSEPPTGQEQGVGVPAPFNAPCDWLCQLKQRQAQRLEGSWVITVTPVPAPGAPPLPDRHVYTTFARGGAAIGSDRGLPFASPQHGAWEHKSGNEFAYTSIQDLFDAAGNFLGTLKVRWRITMTGQDEFAGVANPQIRDAAGNITLDACSTFKATRVETEPLSERCRSITPPQ